MTLRKGSYGGILVNNGKIVSGDAECGCCLCCWKYSGDEKMVNGLGSGYFLELGDIVVTINDSTLITGVAAGNFCEVKFELDLTVEDLVAETSCTTTGVAELICDCDLCPDDVFWEFTLTDCGSMGIPATFWMGDGCKDANCDDPNCSNCADYGIDAGGVSVSDPDGSVVCQCPGDYCTGGGEVF